MSADGKFNKSLFGFNKRQVLGFFEDYQNEKQAEIDEIKEQKKILKCMEVILQKK